MRVGGGVVWTGVRVRDDVLPPSFWLWTRCHHISDEIPNWSSYPMMFPCIHESYVFFHYEEETCFTYRWEIWTQHRMKRKDKTERTFYYTSIIS